MRKPIAILVQ